MSDEEFVSLMSNCLSCRITIPYKMIDVNGWGKGDIIRSYQASFEWFGGESTIIRRIPSFRSRLFTIIPPGDPPSIPF